MADAVLRGAEGEGVVGVGELRRRRGQGIYLGGQGVAGAVPLRIASGEVECGGRGVHGMGEEDEQEGDGGGRAERSHGAMAFHFEVGEAIELQPGRSDP